MKKISVSSFSVWLQLYFVCATLLGLVCLVIGVSTLINTFLTSTVFKVRENIAAPPQPYMEITKLQEPANLTPEEKQALAQWQADYSKWQRNQASYDFEAENRKRSLAWSLALILTGAPVFALHAPVVFRKARS